MSSDAPLKLLPRNVAAYRRGADLKRAPRLVPGNAVSTRLESGVGNCFPGLECDLRNLERRFFPFLEVDMVDDLGRVRVVSVDVAGVNAAAASGAIDAQTAASYRVVAQTMPAAPTTANAAWMIRVLEGTFGPLGPRTLTLPLQDDSSFGPQREPPDAWTAIRMLTEGTEVRIELARANATPVTLRGRRARYLDDNGALADMFLPGELTQSLCSPWTHDFRDCGCFYWASNHPDITLPPDPPANTTDVRWNQRVIWQRRDRTPGQPGAPATDAGPDAQQMAYHEINRDWQRLNFVLEQREQTAPYRQRPGSPTTPFAPTALEAQLRYAAGVELAVMHAYLAAAFSLRDPATVVGNPNLADDIAAAHYEIVRIAVGEMRHIRAVRDVLAAGAVPPFDPPLRIATRVPGLLPADPPRMLVPSALTQDALKIFIQIEAPNVAVDGLYNRILATLELVGNDRSEQSIRRIQTEGEDHQKVFKAIQEWLKPHQASQYLRAPGLAAPPPGQAAHAVLQTRYRAVLEGLHAGYSQTTVAGAPSVIAARETMIGPLLQACEAVAQAGFLVTFDRIADPRFAAIDPPP
jgi:hypothetical protein